jgi:hypothetical protein
LYLGKIKNTENITRLKKKYKPRYLFSNLLFLKKTIKLGNDNNDIIIMGEI